jgi:glycosyltransferase involved in cell wall biosynthesis
LEAAAMGCNVTITDKGYTKEYFGDHAFYCDPGDPGSIYDNIESAANSEYSKELQQKITQQYTWQQAANITMKAYQKILS